MPSPTLPLIKYAEANKGSPTTHKKSSPFTSMWYCWGGSDGNNGRLVRKAMEVARGGGIDVARSKSALRDLRRKK
ncbi:hypothetical protein TrCOL_g13546 [Triparma columacea]|uniref:Uncharacterized protein n=1 Tax=Triparma columacea TaxID=722753 RepID=A0A9W7GGR0_9STRA|nr:hypothetical protein TrCOL_g13546 [Triparma columacea]